MGPHGERDLSVERSDMEDDKKVTRLHKELKKHTDRERKHRDHDDRDPDSENNGEATTHRLSEKRKSARKMEDSTLASYDDKDASKGELLITTVHAFVDCTEPVSFNALNYFLII